MSINDGINLRITIHINLPVHHESKILHLLNSSTLYIPYDWTTISDIHYTYFSFLIGCILYNQDLVNFIRLAEKSNCPHGLLTDITLEFSDMSLIWFALAAPADILKHFHLIYDNGKKTLVYKISDKYSIKYILDLLKVLCFISDQ